MWLSVLCMCAKGGAAVAAAVAAAAAGMLTVYHVTHTRTAAVQPRTAQHVVSDALMAREVTQRVRAGDIIRIVHRPVEQRRRIRADSKAEARVVTWNIEYGAQLGEVVKELRSLHADVLLLQEVDIGCSRSGDSNVLWELATQLGMHAVFVAEFEELPSRLRPGKVRVDTRGVHGNAILSTFPIDRVWTVPHPNGFNWGRYSPLLLQPRMGHRVTLGAEMSVPTGGGVQKTRVYSLHLECVAGSRVRMLQLADVLADAQQQRQRHGSAVNVFGGDANTLLTGMMKWNPLYWDRYTLAMVDLAESQVWRRVLARRCERNLRGVPLPARLVAGVGGLAPLCEPFHPTSDVTRGGVYWAAKLDWLVFETSDCTTGQDEQQPTRVEAIQSVVGNTSASDHQWLMVDLRLTRAGPTGGK